MSSEVDHDKLLNNNFWGYIKKFFKKKSESLPTFDLSQCTTYFTKTLSAVIPNKSLTFLVGFQSLIPRQHHLILTLRPTMRFQMSFER